MRGHSWRVLYCLIRKAEHHIPVRSALDVNVDPVVRGHAIVRCVYMRRVLDVPFGEWGMVGVTMRWVHHVVSARELLVVHGGVHMVHHLLRCLLHEVHMWLLMVMAHFIVATLLLRLKGLVLVATCGFRCGRLGPTLMLLLYVVVEHRSAFHHTLSLL